MRRRSLNAHEYRVSLTVIFTFTSKTIKHFDNSEWIPTRFDYAVPGVDAIERNGKLTNIMMCSYFIFFYFFFFPSSFRSRYTAEISVTDFRIECVSKIFVWSTPVSITIKRKIKVKWNASSSYLIVLRFSYKRKTNNNNVRRMLVVVSQPVEIDIASNSWLLMWNVDDYKSMPGSMTQEYLTGFTSIEK